MDWWRWVAAATAALLTLALLALRFDTLKDRRGSSPASAARTLAPFAVLVPVVFGLALVGPWWLTAIAVAVPGVTLLTMAAID